MTGSETKCTVTPGTTEQNPRGKQSPGRARGQRGVGTKKAEVAGGAVQTQVSSAGETLEVGGIRWAAAVLEAQR